VEFSEQGLPNGSHTQMAHRIKVPMTNPGVEGTNGLVSLQHMGQEDVGKEYPSNISHCAIGVKSAVIAFRETCTPGRLGVD